MTNKFPTGQSFQRLNNIPLDETIVFDTLAQAQDYASNNPTAYAGQIIHVKDARTIKELENEINTYEESCYIDYYKKVKPICSFTYKSMGIFFDLMNDIINNYPEETKEKLNKLHESMYDDYTHDFNDYTPSGDYKTEPWNPANFNDNQICLKMTTFATDEWGSTIEIIGNYNGSYQEINYHETATRRYYHKIEHITIGEGDEESYYKVITFTDKNPIHISFKNGNHIEKVIHMIDVGTSIENMFSGCTNLTEIKGLESWDVSSIVSMSSAFENCSKLTNIDTSNWEITAASHYFRNMFAGCSSLKSIDLTAFNKMTNTLEEYDISGMFKNCTSLTTIDVSSIYSKRITNISYLFAGCSNLETIIGLDKFDTSNVEGMGSLFTGCAKLNNINTLIRNFDTSNVTDLSNMFEGCLMAELDLSHFNIENVSATRSMFKDCVLLQSLNLSNWSTPLYSVGWYSDMFKNCQLLELENINTSNCNEYMINAINNAIANK